MKSLSIFGLFLLLFVGTTGAFAQSTELSTDTFPSVPGVQLNRARSSSDPSWAKFASGSGNILFLAAGTLLPLVEDGKDGKEHTFRTADSLLVSTVVAEGLKIITNEKRPDGSDRRSFPSGHATAAFAVAAMQAHYHPHQALLWYGGATIIGASRVKLDRHYWHDVVAGAALGYFTSKFELKQPHGFVLRPLISEDKGKGRTAALSISHSF